MSYVIMETKEYGSEDQVVMEREGQSYRVSYRSVGDSQWASRSFDNLHEALGIYDLFVDAFALGLYDHTDRKRLLNK